MESFPELECRTVGERPGDFTSYFSPPYLTMGATCPPYDFMILRVPFGFLLVVGVGWGGSELSEPIFYHFYQMN